jgi:hypothetical protein
MTPARGAMAAAALLAIASLTGCGTATEDLIAIQVTGGPAHVHERIRVTDDGRASCGGPLRQISSQVLLDAREAKRLLRPYARNGASFLGGRRGVRQYVVRSFDGTLHFSEGAPGPVALGRITLVALHLERELCNSGG